MKIVRKRTIFFARNDSVRGMGSFRNDSASKRTGSFRRRHSLLLGLDRGFDRFVHLAVAGAAAKVATQGIADFCIGRIRICREQVCDGHHEAGSAEAALRASPIAVGFLDCSQGPVLADAFDGGDFLAFATRGEHGAGEHGQSINQNSAGAARGVVAAALGSGKLQVYAQGVKQEAIGLDREFMRAAIDAKFEELFFHYCSS